MTKSAKKLNEKNDCVVQVTELTNRLSLTNLLGKRRNDFRWYLVELRRPYLLSLKRKKMTVAAFWMYSHNCRDAMTSSNETSIQHGFENNYLNIKERLKLCATFTKQPL